MALLRSLYRSSTVRSLRYTAVSSNHFLHGALSGEPSRTFFSQSQPSLSTFSRHHKSPFAVDFGKTRSFSADIASFPAIKDSDILNVFKDFMASKWDELPEALVHDAINVLSKITDDKVGKEALENVFRAAEAVEEFTGTLVSLKMELDDSVGFSGEVIQELCLMLSDGHSPFSSSLFEAS